MPQRKCTKSKENVKQVSKRIVLPLEIEMYKAVVVERKWVDEIMGTYPELFPSGIAAKGSTLHDKRVSLKMPETNLRWIKLSPGQVFTIAPSGVLPYMTGYTDDVEKPLFLRRFGVPFWALSYVFGRDGS